MKAVGRIVLAIAALLIVAGATISLLPYDTTAPMPALAGQTGLSAEVRCKAPIVDLVTEEPGDVWLDYRPDEGVAVDASSRSGGEYCADTMRTRGTFGLVLLVAGVCFAAAALVAGRLRTAGEDAGGADERTELDGPDEAAATTDAARPGADPEGA